MKNTISRKLMLMLIGGTLFLAGWVMGQRRASLETTTVHAVAWTAAEDATPEGFENFKFKSYIIWKYAGSFDSTKKRFHLDYEVIYHLSKGDDIYLSELAH